MEPDFSHVCSINRFIRCQYSSNINISPCITTYPSLHPSSSSFFFHSNMDAQSPAKATTAQPKAATEMSAFSYQECTCVIPLIAHIDIMGASAPASKQIECQKANRLRGGGAGKVSIAPPWQGRTLVLKLRLAGRIASWALSSASSVSVSSCPLDLVQNKIIDWRI